MLKKTRARLRALLRRAAGAARDTGAAELFASIFREYRWLAIGALAAIFVSVLGYRLAGLSFVNALYAALTLFSVNPVEPASNGWIVLGQYLSLIVVTGVVVNVVGYALRAVSHFRVNRAEDSTAVYTDHPWGERLAGALRHGYLGDERGEGRLENARYQIIMYGDDRRSLSFYAANAERLRERTVYIMLTGVDAFLLKSGDSGGAEGPRFFNPYDLMARVYWRRHSLYDLVGERNGAPVRVAVTDYGPVGRAVCRYAVLNNVYRLNQRVEYHVWGCDDVQRQFLERLSLMNGDSIVAEPGEAIAALDRLAAMDRVILAGENQLELLQQLLLSSTRAQLHWYGGGMRAEELFAGNAELASFGDMGEVLTEDAIKSEALYRGAKLLNYDFELRARYAALAEELPEEAGGPEQAGSAARGDSLSRAEALRRELPEGSEAAMEQSWRGLDGFLKGSNIARADHLWIERRLEADGLAAECPELEHIRWCRYHFYNHWRYDPLPGLAQSKDKSRRLHRMLVPFDRLDEENKGKDDIFNARIRAELEALDGYVARG